MSSSAYKDRIAVLVARKEARKRAEAAAQSQPAVATNTNNAVTTGEPVIDIDDIEVAEAEPYVPVRVVVSDDLTPAHREAIARWFKSIMQEQSTANMVAHYGLSVMLEQFEIAAKEHYPRETWYITRPENPATGVEGSEVEEVAAQRSVLSNSDEVFMFGNTTEFAGGR